jgi:hypothetical protein
MIHMKPLGSHAFLLSATEPMRVEVRLVAGTLIAHAYTGTTIDREQDPVGAFDSSIGLNEEWESGSAEGAS